MRDAFLLAVLPFMLYAIARRPFIGLGLWIWTALFFPNGWVYGPAAAIRYNLLFAALAIFSYLTTRYKPRFAFSGTAFLVLLFFAWTTGSTMTALGRPELAWEIWDRFMKVVVLFVFVLAIVDSKLHFDFFLGCVVLSVGFYADIEALKFLASGGGHKIEGMAGHVLGDRNELAVAFVMLLPICAYLLREYGKQSRALSIGLLGTIALTVVAIVGTQSRGGFIALLALGAYFFIKTDRKLLVTTMVAVLALGVSQVATAEWLSRIDSINSAGKDASFMGRVVAWKLSMIMAMRHPFFGGGFKGLEYFPVWSSLSQDFFSYPWFYTGDALPDTEKARAAHSVYFQVLGDHGFFGLAIYLGILVGAFRTAQRVARRARAAASAQWIAQAATTLQLTLFAFCVGGAALSFAYFDLTFAIIALLIVLEKRILPRALAEAPR
ncbi:putative O-glycosylation ligase, exosortase A system-associated [Massilia agilis]|uniref:O-glycosylation ligase, exosortase A system-associated n=1 Tax=Massilia agilis TaxID=1811226 RepID=A0ABT2DFE9_9BURK|nr:putative O-glycosylation ligase, exosortase A system-associated [Massilia agilis]MCS0809148.1 putative O-glycosylation ligase, exosortase A system-associated [Massilia agilis]